MKKTRKKLLPKDFEDLLKEGDLHKLQAVFESCDINARGGSSKQPALSFDDCPPELAAWLVSQGADLAATDTWGNTPLHKRAGSWRGNIVSLLDLGADVNCNTSTIGTPLHAAADRYNVANARLLIERGADVDARNADGMTPLELALRRCNNVDLAEMAPLAELLLAAGASRTPRMKDFVTELGKRFEFHRSAFNRDMLEAASSGLDRLYQLFDVAPVVARVVHDGISRIVVKDAPWQDQHEMLWDMLVPSNGCAATVQGEVIRISGRIAREINGNGGANWDADFRAMANAFVAHLKLAESSSDLIKDTARMAELAVAWVLQNPDPIPLSPPKYRR